ncbi:hypothetical protein EV356DRAFT_497675 [Viridothelium virens]|uniref:Uncharacterized protein n=1 Tax=Viridothelium virens TaxID=1048519 RepID=A0A6A6HFC1_VIRVR|nr:hypothetical protein EV356DRAFT_497675 [Viridothelium virens]
MQQFHLLRPFLGRISPHEHTWDSVPEGLINCVIRYESLLGCTLCLNPTNPSRTTWLSSQYTLYVEPDHHCIHEERAGQEKDADTTVGMSRSGMAAPIPPMQATFGAGRRYLGRREGDRRARNKGVHIEVGTARRAVFQFRAATQSPSWTLDRYHLPTISRPPTSYTPSTAT